MLSNRRVRRKIFKKYYAIIKWRRRKPGAELDAGARKPLVKALFYIFRWRAPRRTHSSPSPPFLLPSSAIADAGFSFCFTRFTSFPAGFSADALRAFRPTYYDALEAFARRIKNFIWGGSGGIKNFICFTLLYFSLNELFLLGISSMISEYLL